MGGDFALVFNMDHFHVPADQVIAQESTVTLPVKPLRAKYRSCHSGSGRKKMLNLSIKFPGQHVIGIIAQASTAKPRKVKLIEITAFLPASPRLSLLALS